MDAEPLELFGDVGGALLVGFYRDHVAEVADPRRDLARLDAGSGAEVEHPLVRPGIERFDHRRRSARLGDDQAGGCGFFDCGGAAAGDQQLGRGQWPGAFGRSEFEVLAREARNHLVGCGAQGVHPYAALGRQIVGRKQRPRPFRSQLLPPELDQPVGGRMRHRGRLHGGVVGQTGGDLVAFAKGPPEDRVDEAGGVVGTGLADEADRLVDGGVVGGRVGEEDLVHAQPQRRHHRRQRTTATFLLEAMDEGVRGPLALDRPVGEPLGLCPGAGFQAPPFGFVAEGDLGEFVLLEGAAEHGEGRLPLVGDAAHRSFRAGTGRP